MKTLVASAEPPRGEHQQLFEALQRLRAKAVKEVRELPPVR